MTSIKSLSVCYTLPNRTTTFHNVNRFWNRRQYSSSSEQTALKPFDSIPGLPTLPLIGPMHHFLPVIGKIGPPENFFKMTDVLYKEYGPIVKLDGVFSRESMLFLYEPDLFEQVYRVENATPIRPGFATLEYYRTELRKSTFEGVHGLTTAQGQNWREFRTKVNPALLKPKLVKLYAPALDEIAQEMVTSLSKVKDENYLQWNLDLELMKWSLESIGIIALGARLGCMNDNLPEDHPGRVLMKCAKDIMFLSFELEFKPSLWKYFPVPNYKKIMKTYDTQWEYSAMFIEQARNVIRERGHDIPEEDKSIIEKLLAIDEKVAVMMASEMLFAGIDTVAYTMTGLLFNLAMNPKEQEKLREEARSGDTSKRYIKACIKESLRLYPVLACSLRRTTKDHVVDGYHVPKGVDVVAPHEYISRMEKYFPQPTEFIPERWLAEKTDPLYYGNTHPMVTLPFGFGTRSCIGRRIAELEIETLTQKIVDQFKIGWEGPPIKVITKVTNTFTKPYHFKFEAVNE